MKKPGVLNIAIQNKHKTSHREAGINTLDMPDGTRFCVLGFAYFPDHDRSLFEHLIFPALKAYKPDAIFLMGGMLHDESFQELAPYKGRKVAVHEHELTPEVQAAKDHSAIWAQRTLYHGRECGKFITSFAEACDANVYFAGSASALLPNEAEIMTFLYHTQEQVNAFYEKNKDEAPDPSERPAVPTNSTAEDFQKLLDISDPRVDVWRFGSCGLINGEHLIEIGDQRRRYPVSSVVVDQFKKDRRKLKTVIKTFDGKSSNGWLTLEESSMPVVRRHNSFHEVGNCMCSTRMGYLRDYDMWAKSMFFGELRRGFVHGSTVPFKPDKDGKRRLVYDGMTFVEPTPGGQGLILPAKKLHLKAK